MPTLEPQQRLYSNLLGDCYPYWWFDDDGSVHFAEFAPEALQEYPASRRHFDPVSALSLFSFEHLTLDRTMVQGLNRLPWLGEVDGEGTVRYAHAPPHGLKVESTREIARQLLALFKEELRQYCAGESSIFVLLSGGMDSRVMAATLRELEQNGEIDGTIRVMTWGVPGCRDVLYGRRLAEIFGWEWTHAPIDASTHWGSFELAATHLGGEVDPKHIHRMDWFRDVEEPSLVLVASYGDSVGRAEFSSIHLTEVPPLRPRDRNRLLNERALTFATDRLDADIRELRFRHGKRSELGYRELGRQAHYMRRMLQSTTCIINQWGHRMEQAFVTPPVFEFMWAYDPQVRTDQIYVEVLRMLDESLLDIAWARTGGRYDTGEGSDDAEKQLHRYGYWLREDHADKLSDLLFGRDTLRELDTFDMDQVAWMFDDWLREESNFETELCTQISMLGTISMFAEHYGVLAPTFEPADVRARFAANVGKVASRMSQQVRRVSRPLRLQAAERLADWRNSD